jgi:hypothetical protein
VNKLDISAAGRRNNVFIVIYFVRISCLCGISIDQEDSNISA